MAIRIAAAISTIIPPPTPQRLAIIFIPITAEGSVIASVPMAKNSPSA